MNALLALAFSAGMLALVNPCGFALLPAWIGHSLTGSETAPLAVRLLRGLGAGATLTVGFAGTLAAAGLAVSAGARGLITAAPWLGLTIGIVLVVLGAAMLAGLPLRLRLPVRAARPVGGPTGRTARLALFGAGYAVASLSCTFGVLLAVIAQAQATANYTGVLAVFAVYALGSASILLLVSLGTAVAGAVLTRHVTALTRHGPRISAVILTLTGAYLAWYWYPTATGYPATSGGVAGWSAAVTSWLHNHTSTVALFAASVVLTVTATALRHCTGRTTTTEPARRPQSQQDPP